MLLRNCTWILVKGTAYDRCPRSHSAGLPPFYTVAPSGLASLTTNVHAVSTSLRVFSRKIPLNYTAQLEIWNFRKKIATPMLYRDKLQNQILGLFSLFGCFWYFHTWWLWLWTSNPRCSEFRKKKIQYKIVIMRFPS